MKQCSNTIEEFAENYRQEFMKRWKYAIYELTAEMNHALKDKSYSIHGVALKESEIRNLYERRIKHAQEMLEKVDYYVQKKIQEYKKPTAKKDNYNLYNGEKVEHYYDGYFARYDSRIRVPKLKRKSAWKRFYKLYPELKGLESITGKSNCAGVPGSGLFNGNLRSSMIKLKKI